MSNQPQLSLKKLYSGKVRDLYEIDAQRSRLIDDLEGRLASTSTVKEVFKIQWELA